MGNSREINAHDLGMWSLEEREKAVAQSRGGIDIDTTEDSRQGVISGSNDIDFLLIDALVFVIEQWDQILSGAVS